MISHHIFLQRDWYEDITFLKPAVLAVFILYKDVGGDPNAWGLCAERLNSMAELARQLGSALAAVILSPSVLPELAPDRLSMVSRAAGIDKKCVEVTRLLLTFRILF